MVQRRGRYRRTASGAHVNMQALERLASLGYARALAAEALRQVRWDLWRGTPMQHLRLPRGALC